MKIRSIFFSTISISILLNLLIYLTGCAFKTVHRDKNIVYSGTAGKKSETLNIYSPKKNKELKQVLIFIYGGSWNSGRKELYSFLGNRMARKNIVTVIVDYPKSPAATYDEMANDVAKAVKWTKNNIIGYGGDPKEIFISGHSAGGHLAALVGIKNEYFFNVGINNPLKGIILIDAAGLDMYGYLKNENFKDGNTYLQTFTNNPLTWKKASPIYFLHDSMPPFLIYRGGKTYPSIETSNEKFATALKAYIPHPRYHILKGKKHIPMILQFLNPCNHRYQEIIKFMKEQS